LAYENRKRHEGERPQLKNEEKLRKKRREFSAQIQKFTLENSTFLKTPKSDKNSFKTTHEYLKKKDAVTITRALLSKRDTKCASTHSRWLSSTRSSHIFFSLSSILLIRRLISFFLFQNLISIEEEVM